jgi:hypothetical protein
MPPDTASWRELKEFAQCEPSALAFRALVALLDTWPGDDQAAAIAYANQLLSRWPDGVRLAPWSWCKAAPAGAVPPYLISASAPPAALPSAGPRQCGLPPCL